MTARHHHYSEQTSFGATIEINKDAQILHRRPKTPPWRNQSTAVYLHAKNGSQKSTQNLINHQRERAQNDRNYFHSRPHRHLPPFQWEHFDFLHFFFLLATTRVLSQAITK